MYPGEPQYSAPPQRPTSVTVIAIIAIVFGALGILCCTPMGVMPYVTDAGGPNPVVEMTKARPLLFGWTIFQMVVSFFIYVVLLIAGIGALGLKNWARLLLMAQAVVSILFQLVGIVIAAITLMPMLSDMEGPMRAGVMGGAGCGFLIGLAVNGAVLFVMTRPNVKAAFGA